MRAQPQPVIPVTVLETKLYVPRPREGRVSRARLSERLDRGVGSKLTLVSAPAGFGKTTLLTEWLAGRSSDGRARLRGLALLGLRTKRSCAVLDLRHRGVASLPGSMGATALALLQSPGARPSGAPDPAQRARRRRRRCGARAGRLPRHRSREIHDGMAFLLEHLPPQLHLVITTRADPPLPLARLRARGELVEMRAADLRFTADEARPTSTTRWASISPRARSTPSRPTEGWIAALQLAALSLQGRDDAAAFIAGFAGDDRYVVDYLVEEVLQRQPETSAGFLLADLDPEPAERAAVRRRHRRGGGRAMLGRSTAEPVPGPARRSAPVVPLPPPVRRRAAGAARSTSDPSWSPALHRRASEWYADMVSREAIRHALAGGHVERAAELIELASPAMRRDRQEPRSVAGSRRCPKTCSDPAGAARRVRRCAAGHRRAPGSRHFSGRRALARVARPTSDGPPPTGWSWSTSGVRHAAGLDRRVPRRAGAAAPVTSTNRGSRPPGARARATTMTSSAGAGTALIGLASWSLGDLETRTRRTPPPRQPRAGRPHRRRARMRDHARRHPGRAGPAR